MKISELAGKRVLILGYGKEGKATEKFLRAKCPTAQIEIADESLDPNYLDRQKECDVAIKTPGMKLDKLTVPHTTATNLFFANITNRVIGITGSKGKSTTSSLITAILHEAGIKSRLIGNIGYPALEVLLDPVDPAEVFVMELSSYQLEDIEYSPYVSVITSIFREHLDHHGDFQKYLAAKARILAKATERDFYVYNSSYPELDDLRRHTVARGMPYIKDIPFDVSGLKLLGGHNLENVRGAITAARIFGVSDEMCERAVLNFDPLPHRLTLVGEFRGIKFYDDAIATAPEPTIFALRTLGDVDTILLGGTDRGYDFSNLAEALAALGTRNIVLFPDTGAKIKAELEKQNAKFNLLQTESMEAAVKFAYQHTAPGMSCLLSTASPSYSLWKNFEVKGDEFVRWVIELAKD